MEFSTELIREYVRVIFVALFFAHYFVIFLISLIYSGLFWGGGNSVWHLLLIIIMVCRTILSLQNLNLGCTDVVGPLGRSTKSKGIYWRRNPAISISL